MTDSAISLRTVSHSAVGGRGIINDLNLNIPDGEVFAIIGPSGCGKTTTLKLISGLERPSKGDVSVFGRPAHAYKPWERCVATVFQSRALFPGMSVGANIEFGLKVKKYPKDERTGRIRAISEKFHLDGLLDRDVGKLSGGEQQRIALARSLVVEPKILLLDEPYTGLDQMLRNSLQRDLKTLMEERNRTYVLVSHDFDNVLALVDRVAVMKAGEIVQLGAPSDILENPKSSFIVNLLGWSNLIPGTLVEAQDDNRRVRVRTGSGMWWGRSTDRENFSPRKEQNAFYVIHPQDILLDGSGDCRVDAAFRAIEASQFYDMALFDMTGGNTLRVLVPHNLKFQLPSRGEAIPLSWNSHSALVLED